MTWGATEAGQALAQLYTDPGLRDRLDFEYYFNSNVFDKLNVSREQAEFFWNTSDLPWQTYFRSLVKFSFEGADADTAVKKAQQQMVLKEFEVYGANGRPSRSGTGGGPSAAQRAAQITAELRNLANQFGVGDYADWDSIGRDAANNNWNAAMVKDLVASYIDYNAMQRAGYVRDIHDKTKATGAKYFVRLGDEEVLNYARQVASDDLSEESLLGVIKQRAKAQYSWLSDVIDSGTSLDEYFKPHREEIARLLEVSPDSVNFMDDPKWQKVVQRPTDTNDTSLRSMSLFETQQYVRGLSEWKATNNARTEAANMVGALAQVFGGM